jgi:hypothetical protein
VALNWRTCTLSGNKKMLARCTVRWLTTKQSTIAPFEVQLTSATQRHREARRKRQGQRHQEPTETDNGKAFLSKFKAYWGVLPDLFHGTVRTREVYCEALTEPYIDNGYTQMLDPSTQSLVVDFHWMGLAAFPRLTQIRQPSNTEGAGELQMRNHDEVARWYVIILLNSTLFIIECSLILLWVHILLVAPVEHGKSAPTSQRTTDKRLFDPQYQPIWFNTSHGYCCKTRGRVAIKQVSNQRRSTDHNQADQPNEPFGRANSLALYGRRHRCRIWYWSSAVIRMKQMFLTTKNRRIRDCQIFVGVGNRVDGKDGCIIQCKS